MLIASSRAHVCFGSAHTYRAAVMVNSSKAKRISYTLLQYFFVVVFFLRRLSLFDADKDRTNEDAATEDAATCCGVGRCKCAATTTKLQPIRCYLADAEVSRPMCVLAYLYEGACNNEADLSFALPSRRDERNSSADKLASGERKRERERDRTDERAGKPIDFCLPISIACQCNRLVLLLRACSTPSFYYTARKPSSSSYRSAAS